MRKLLLLVTVIASFATTGYSQEKMQAAKPTEKDKTEAIPTDSYLKRGEPIGSAKRVALAKVFKDPAKYAGQKLLVEGTVIRSCKTEGCWAELAPDKDSKRSVRVKMKNHAFFIPLQSAGSLARAEGTFSVKTLTKAEVDHLMNEDGAKFDNRNADGSVMEISFEATGIELRRSGR